MEPRPPWNACSSPRPHTPGLPQSLFCPWREHTHPRRGPTCGRWTLPLSPFCLVILWALFPCPHLPSPQQMLPVHRSGDCSYIRELASPSAHHTHSPRSGLLGVTMPASTMSPQRAWVVFLSSGPHQDCHELGPQQIKSKAGAKLLWASWAEADEPCVGGPSRSPGPAYPAALATASTLSPTPPSQRSERTESLEHSVTTGCGCWL